MGEGPIRKLYCTLMTGPLWLRKQGRQCLGRFRVGTFLRDGW